VTVVDAKHLPLRLKDSREAEDQIAFADVILLNKTDLVAPQALAEVEAVIRTVNPYAEIYRTQRSQIALDRILDRGVFDLQRVLSIEPGFLQAGESHEHHDCEQGCTHEHHHHAGLSAVHDVTVGSVSLRTGELDQNKFFPWIHQLTQQQGPRILRMKGILAFRDEARRYALQGVHMIVEGDHQRPWKPDEKRESRLVLIGRELDRGRLSEGLQACLA
jgi:G3E family GTPase